MTNKTIIILIFLMCSIAAHAQELHSWGHIKNDPEKLEQHLAQLDANKDLSRDSLQVLLRNGYEHFLQTGFKEGQAELLLRLGNLFSVQNMFDAAEDAYKESLSLFITLENELKTAYAYSGYGTAMGRRGEYDASTVHLISALQIFEKLGNKTGIANIYLKLGTVYTYISNLDLGLEYYKKALEIALEHDKLNVITIYANIAYIYMERGEFEKSEEYFKLAINYEEVPSSPRPKAQAYINLGQLFKLQGDTDMADFYLDQGAKLAEEGNLVEELIGIALIRIDESTPAKRAASLQELIDLKEKAKSYELKYMQFEILSKIVELGKSLKLHEQTIGWMEEREKIEKQLFDERKERDIANLRASYQLDKSRLEIEDLNVQISVQNRIRNMTLIFFGISIIGFLISFYFYLDAKRANKLLKTREKELSASARLKDQLFSIIGHDLKNAISSQPIVLDLMRSGKENREELEGLIEGLEASIHNVLYVLDTLLNWGKMQFKGVSVKPRQFDVYPMVENSVRLLRLSAQLKEIQITNLISPATLVFADQEHFKFVVRNLLSNSIKYSRKGEEIKLGVHSVDKEEVVFYVEDHGVGMTPEEVEMLFDPNRSSKPGTANETGNGIALILSQEFVVKNSGRIWVESQKGQGTTFYFSLKSSGQE